MKKALVMTVVLVLGLGLFASAQTWEGTWDTDITVYPSVAEFSDFIGFDSDLTVTYSIGGWDFSMDADFSVGGMDGLGFDAEGVIGAFSFDIDMDFAPMKVIQVETSYVGLGLLASGTTDCLLQTNSWTYTSKTVKKTYMPAFDDLTVTGSVSIAGLNFEGLFFLKGTDADHATKYSQYVTTTDGPAQFSKFTGEVPVQTTSLLTVASSTKVGTGAKFTISGSLAGATVTNYAYFNLKEYSYNDYQTIIVEAPKTYIKDSLKMSGTLIGLECPGCDVAFTRNYTLIEGLGPFADCLTVDLAIDFSCCDFEGFSILFKDISLGCCWDLSFDFLIDFDTTSKTMTLEPEMTFANGCFTIAAEVVWDDTNVITGIELEGFSYSHTFNGVTVSFAATWDYSDNPLLGTYGYVDHHSGTVVYYWKPDTHNSVLIGDAATDTKPAVENSGVGSWVLASASCYYERAYIYNKLSLDFDADGCCGGLFDLDVDTYFGSITAYTLTGVYGTYLYDEDGADWEVDLDFLGSANAWEIGIKTGTTPNAITTTLHPFWAAATPSDDDCAVCPAPATHAVEYLLIDTDYSSTAINSIFGWVETDADIVFGVGSNISLGLGLDVAWWGWQNISFSIEFTW